MLLACAALFAAPPPADFWTAKDYTEWTEREAQRMLSDSPWARPVDVRATAPAPSALSAGRSRPDRNLAPLDPDVAAPAFRAIVRCQSALPVRHALARIRYGVAGLASPEAQDLVGREQTHYVFAAAGVPERFMSAPRAFMRVKGRTAVEAEKTGAGREGDRIAVYAVFPRLANPIAIDDGEFEIVFRLAAAEIRKTFRVRDLVYRGQPEL